MNLKLVMPLALAGAGLAAAQTTTTGVFGQSTDLSRTVVLEANLQALNENPPVATRAASGRATVVIRLDRTSVSSAAATSGFVSVHINATTTEAETVTAAHIHRGRTGANGPVVVDFQFRQPANTVANQSASLSNQFEVTNADTVKVLEEIVANPANFYVNVHTQSNPGGHIRGQLEGQVTTERLESRLNTVVDADLLEIRRLLILIAAETRAITPQERDTLMKTLTDRMNAAVK